MAKIWLSATGNTIQGHVLDASRAPLEEMLRDYDPQLYIKWNPNKLRGWGCWEIRRRPNEKDIIETFHFEGMAIAVLAYKELNIINHVMDVPFLNYSVMDKLKGMDQWKDSYKGKDFTKNIEYAEAKYDEKVEDKIHADREYNLKQMKSEIRYFKDYVLSGHNPARIADYWK